MALDSTHSRRSSITSRITGYVFLIIASSLLAFAWLVHTQLQWSVQQQADALGHSLLQQTRSVAEGALSADDTLSVAVLLRDLVNNPYVSHAALYSVDNRILAEAGKRPKSTSTLHNLYSQQLSFEDVIAGSLHLHIDINKLQQPLTTSMQSMAVLGVVLLLLALILSVRLGRSLALPLQSLSNWLINPAPPAPFIQRSDEIGLLARQLNQYFIDDTQTTAAPVLEPAEDLPQQSTPDTAESTINDEHVAPYQHLVDTIPLSALDTVRPYAVQPVTSRTAVLAVEFGSMEQLRQLPSERFNQLTKKYRQAVQQSAALYGGQLHALTDGRSLITFHSEHDEYPRNALCCGELLRAFGHALQIEVADSGIVLHIQLGLSEGPSAKDVSLGELLLSESVQTALSLSQHSRNLLLLSDSLAQHNSIAACARIRPITQPADASCLESLLSPYPALLQNQLHNLQKHNPS
jgi:uncharacterized membrane protein affecting hemolysin expression